MGLFSSLFGSKQAQPTTSKMKIGGLMASTIDHVLQEAGMQGLAAGSIVLDKALRVSFRSGKVAKADNLAAVHLENLQETKSLAHIYKYTPESPFVRMNVDQLSYAVMREFQKQWPEFANIPTT